jgi:NAD(P)-dependent dehydrogenase (short-subunit alcohol dehydrogenase family)
MVRNKGAIITGAQQGIGAALVDGSLKSGHSVVPTSLRASESLRSTPDLVVVDGVIRDQVIAAKIVISAALGDDPIAGVNGSVSMITKDGLNTVTRHLPIEYAKQGVRGIVDAPLHEENPKEDLQASQPMGIIEASDIVDVVLCLSSARQVTGEALHVDGGAHSGGW